MAGGADAAGLTFLQSRDDLPALAPSLDMETGTAIGATDFTSHLVMVALSGTNAAAIRFLRGFLEGGQLWVAADFGDSGFTGTYEAVRIPRAQLGESAPSSWVLVDQEGRVRATAGVPSGGLIFQSIAQAAPGGTEPAKPAVRIAAASEEAETFLPYLTAEHQSAVRNNDWANRAVVAVFLGAVSSNGYRITVRQLRVEQGRLRVTVSVQAPSPDSNVRPAFTSPYHVVSVPKTAFGSSAPSSWLLETSEGKVLAQEP